MDKLANHLRIEQVLDVIGRVLIVLWRIALQKNAGNQERQDDQQKENRVLAPAPYPLGQRLLRETWRQKKTNENGMSKGKGKERKKAARNEPMSLSSWKK